MTICTAVFNEDKRNGLIEKAGKARFCNGKQALERTLWRNKQDGDLFIILDREAYPFKPYKHMNQEEAEPGILYGFI